MIPLTTSTERMIAGHVPASEEGTFLHLPFEMPPGVGRLEVRYDYSDPIDSDPHVTGGNTVDLGLFDERGIGFMEAGFRGWSGSARREFYVTPGEATPGYLPGPLEPGKWHVFLGLYKLSPQGCRYQVTLRLFPQDAEAAPLPTPVMLAVRRDAPTFPAKPDGWYRGELHCHTYHSDGDSAPLELVHEAQVLGLDFLAITDHNTLSHLIDLAKMDTPNLILIPGFEVTTYKGHWNVWGDSGWIDFRTLTAERMADAIQSARERGYLTSCNHPRPYGPPWEFEDIDESHCLEVWNGPWAIFNSVSLAYYEKRLNADQQVVAVGGSDAHRLHAEQTTIARIGTPTTWIYCPGPPNAAALLDGMRAGHVFISESPRGPQLYLTAGPVMMGDRVARPADNRLALTVRVVNGAGRIVELCGASGSMARFVIESPDQVFSLELDVSGTPYVRAQLVGGSENASEIYALTNPIYLK
jgi:hypothetical protein